MFHLKKPMNQYFCPNRPKNQLKVTKKKKTNFQKKKSYLEQYDCNNSLNSLLKKDSFDHSSLWNQVLLILIFLRVQPVILKAPQQNISPRIQPINQDWDKSSQQIIWNLKTHFGKRWKELEFEGKTVNLHENLKTPNKKSNPNSLSFSFSLSKWESGDLWPFHTMLGRLCLFIRENWMCLNEWYFWFFNYPTN